MLKSYFSACWKYESTEEDSPIAGRHIHLAVFDLWDVLAVVEIEGNPQGGTWNHLYTTPTRKSFIPHFWDTTVAEDDLWEVTHVFRTIKAEERRSYKFLDVKHLDTCQSTRIDRSFYHLLVNQQVDLYDPDRDGAIQYQ